jgi:hypothetical protein
VSDVDITGEDSPELRRAMDTAMSLLTVTPDVEGVLMLVFVNDRESPVGTSVSLQLRGNLPRNEGLLKVLQTLLTAEPSRRESS